MEATTPTTNDDGPQSGADAATLDANAQIRRLQAQLDLALAKIHSLAKLLEDANRIIDQLRAEIERLKNGDKPKIDYSMGGEQKRQEAANPHKKKHKKSNSNKKPGRLRTEEKIAKAVGPRIPVYPKGVPEADCTLSHTRPILRPFENGFAYVAYDVYRGPNNQYGKIQGTVGKSEIGIEIAVQITFLVHGIGLSLDKTGQLIEFFQKHKFGKSQIEAILKTLATEWESEFNKLCALLANSVVVHADETSWSLKSVWAFLSEQSRIVLFGVNKNAETLALLLDREKFQGLLVSDDAAVYAGFSKSQKCWAHLLRKSFRIAIEQPCEKFDQFKDKLTDIYREACRIRNDGRLGDEGRAQQVAQLKETLEILIAGEGGETPLAKGPKDDYRKLCNELKRLLDADELFQFVLADFVKPMVGEEKPVSGTNNEAEQAMRNPAMARKTGCTNKTLNGARWKTVLTSILESIRLYVEQFTLEAVLNEIGRWTKTGESCFGQRLKKIEKTESKASILDQLYTGAEPAASG
jgi:transposase